MRSTVVPALAILPPAAAPQPGGATFPRPPEMEHQIRFWRNVFTAYSQDQTVIHDTVDLDKIYTVIDFRQYGDLGYSKIEIENIRKDVTEGEIARIRSLLRRIAEGTPRSALLSDEQRIYDLFRNDPDPYKFLNASDETRVRAQRGIRERFVNGFRTSRVYFPGME